MPRHAPAPGLGNRWSTLGSQPEGFLLVKTPGIHRAPTPVPGQALPESKSTEERGVLTGGQVQRAGHKRRGVSPNWRNRFDAPTVARPSCPLCTFGCVRVHFLHLLPFHHKPDALLLLGRREPPSLACPSPSRLRRLCLPVGYGARDAILRRCTGGGTVFIWGSLSRTTGENGEQPRVHDPPM